MRGRAEKQRRPFDFEILELSSPTEGSLHCGI